MEPRCSHFAFLFLSVLVLLDPSSAICVPRNVSGAVSHGAPAPHTTATPIKASQPAAAPLSGGDPISDSAVELAVKAICKFTDYPETCDTVLKPYFPSSGPITPQVVLGMLIRACTDHTKAAIAAAGKLLSDPSAPAALKPSLKVCADSFSDALDNLDEATAALGTGDKATLNIMVSAALSDYGSCDDAFAEIPVPSPLTTYDDTLSHLASNCLAVSELIHV